jgi:RimJ/RimL family protein N-acetyltransferase
MHNPFLVGQTLYLRVIEEADLNANYREWFNDEEICKYNAHHRFPNYDQDMREYYEQEIKSQRNLVLAICDKKKDKHIGNIALQSIDALNQSAEFAIVIGDRSYWGKGAGKEAAALIVHHGFSELNLHRIYCGTAEDNIGMQKLAQNLGFTEEGRCREALFKSGKFKDMIYYGLLRGKFFETKI